MANLKVSQESAASALAGTEIVRIVQGGNSVRTAISAIATYFRGIINVFSKNQSVAFATLTDGATVSVDASLSNNFYLLLEGDRTLENPTNLTDGMVLNFWIKQDGVGGRTLAFDTKYQFIGNSTLSETPGIVDVISGIYHGSSDSIECVLAAADGAGGGPTGAAGGDLSGTYPNPTVINAHLNPVPSNQAYSGLSCVFTYGESIVPGDAVYVKSDGSAWKADANGSATYPCVGIALETASSGSHAVLLHGFYRDDTRYSWTVGGLVYLSTTAGDLTQSQPSATDDVIQVVGIATHADRLYVKPQLDYITHA